jgi:hypothetical protein
MTSSQSTRKDFEAIEKIVMQVFTTNSLSQFKALPDTFRILPPNHWPSENIHFWGGVAFKIPTDFLGRAEVRLTHLRDQEFLIQIWTVEFDVEKVKIRVSGIQLKNIDKELIRVIEEIRKMNVWPSRCDFHLLQIHPVTGFDIVPDKFRTYKLDAKKR